MSASVSIIMPTYQGARWLPETLHAIRSQAYAAPIEIIAVDSASTDETLHLLATYGARLIPITQAQFSHGYARNLGVRHAQHDLCVFLSQDAQPLGTDWLHTLTAPLADPQLGALYARQVPRPDATPFEAFFIQTLYPPHSTRYIWQHGERLSLERLFFSNVCSAARRTVCLEHPFDETLIMSEDQAFAKVLLTAGYQTLYHAEAAVLHSHHYDLKTLFRRNFDSAYSLRGITEDTLRGNARRAARFIAQEVAYLVRGKHWRWLLRLPFYEAARIGGRLLGRYADKLPLAWRLRLSLHQRFWLNTHAPKMH